MPLRLRVTSHQRGKLGDTRFKEFAACGGTIGRAQDNDWVLPDDKRFISSRHALIDFQGGAYYLVDTSRNGVFVNGADTAVGRGHPQRLFDGDRLRFGEYEIAVQITGGDENIPDDGMRDSVVRAQLVPLDESMDVKLVDESKLRGMDFEALQKHLTPGADAAASGRARTAPVAAQASKPAQRPATPGGAVQAFFTAAGIQPADLGAARPEEAMLSAGRLLREVLVGLAEVIQNRGRVRDALRLTPAVARPGASAPVTSASEALKLLLNNGAGQPEEAVRAAIHDVRHHQQALFRALVHALRDFTERFDPDELRGRFDRGLRRSALLAPTNRFKYWELYEESYQTLTHHDEGSPLPQIVIEELTRAYEQELQSLQHSRSRPGASPPAASG